MDGYQHPTSEHEVVGLIRAAGADGRTLRVRGSGHSVDDAILTGARRDRSVNVLLDRMRSVSFEEPKMLVTAQGGCNLGRDPQNPLATRNNSLVHQLNARGWALPDLGGITHQTVAGFLSTGSAGSSTQFSIHDAVQSVRFVDGLGAINEWSRNDPNYSTYDNPFFGLLPSMGLLGVVTSVTLECSTRYHVRGEEITRHSAGSVVDPTTNNPSLQEYLEDHQYARLFWWPQEGVHKLVPWQAHRMQSDEYTEETGTPENFKARPYVMFQLGVLEQLLGGGVLRFFRSLNPPKPQNRLQRWLEKRLASLYPKVMNSFLKPSQKPKIFWDEWWRAIPMDDAARDKLLPTQFTEAWVPIEEADAVVKELDRYFRDGGFESTGTYACEIYAAKKNDFWLSPSYGHDVVRGGPHRSDSFESNLRWDPGS